MTEMEKYLELKLQQNDEVEQNSSVPFTFTICLIQTFQFSIILFGILRLDESSQSQANISIRVSYPSELCVCVYEDD